MGAESTDVVIVGGGIGGSGLAAVLAGGGLSVTVLERTPTFPDRVRGEMYVPWGVAIADELGLLDPLIAAGATFSTEWVYYDRALPPEVAEQMGVHVPDAVPGSKGILNFTHPEACQALYDHAASRGARMERGVGGIEIELDDGRPTVRWRDAAGGSHTTTARLLVGADGRASVVRKAAGIPLHSDPVRQYITGGLVEGAGLRPHIDAYGTGRDVNFYSFPQGRDRSRVYLAHFDVHRYAGQHGAARFLSDLQQCASPDVAGLAHGRLVTPIATHESVDTWTDAAHAPGVVLVGDAAGYNDPIVGQGLSLTMADVRDVSEALLCGAWPLPDFAPYSDRRRDRHAKQRISSRTSAEMLCAFGPEADARRLRALPLLATDELIGLIVGVLFAGPDILPPGTDTLEAAREAFLAA
jgi:2-polyprenyl-6-methoxyphenol hydroxylase-like FAD-dependent oxidoreductase